MTVIEKILLAAHTLEQNGNSPFTAEDLIVKSWEMDKDLFGLQGYANKHPDSNRILTNIMGTKGLRGKGWIERVGEKRYRLTASGSHVADKLGRRDDSDATRAGSLGRKQVLIVHRLINSPAFKKRINGEDEKIIFRDACNFWGVSAYTNASTLHNQFTELRDVLSELEKAVSGSSTGIIALPDMKIHLDKDTISSLHDIHEFLQKKFFNELEVVRGRSR